MQFYMYVHVLWMTSFCSSHHYKLQSSHTSIPHTSILYVKPGLEEQQPVVVERETLAKMNKNEVFVQKWPAPLRYRYYKHIMPEVPIIMCKSCYRVSFYLL